MTASDDMLGWKMAGVLATLFIVLSMPIYYWSVESGAKTGLIPEIEPQALFVGSRRCGECHRKEYDAWQGSHHDHAMEEAREESVLGDFDGVQIEVHGVKSRFYRRDGRFFVFTAGPEGKEAEFEVTHTFGWFPLQQYLVPFPGGRLQCLPLAWDVRAKRWYHLYPEDPPAQDDWLYWTNAGQNWNSMCAECHSTDLRKNYDLQTGRYATTWSEIDIGCEACHGPGSRHVAWAETPEMGRLPAENAELLVRTTGIGSRAQVELCAPCHSRRAALGDYTHAEADLLDSMLPSLLETGLYFPDGQILDEVYVYGSFTQSKMYHRDVRCSDCHDVHSLGIHQKGNDLCLQCHRGAEYDRKAHHYHKKRGEAGEPIRSSEGAVLFEVGTGAECVQCHMPGRLYMGIDYRPDHSFRIPRPDLSLEIGVPDPCIRCHVDKTSAWSEGELTKCYGPGRREHYGSVLQAGRTASPDARDALIALAADALYPVIVRASALSLLAGDGSSQALEACTRALMDEEALIRRTAVSVVRAPDPQELVSLLGPMLYDAVKAVRIEAAMRLAGIPSTHLRADAQEVFTKVLEEFEAAMRYAGDFAYGRYNLGNLYTALTRPEAAIENYLAATKIDNLFYPAKVNLAMVYDRMGRKDDAERLFREAADEHAGLPEISYSLGLLLAERGNETEAAVYLERAAAGMPKNPRVQYNLGLLLQAMGRDRESEAALWRALALEPESMDYLYALADHYIKRRRFGEARAVAEDMIRTHPEAPVGHKILRMLEDRTPEPAAP